MAKMTDNSNPLCQECLEAEAESNLDINCVLTKVESQKKIPLSDLETRYLCLSLCLNCSYQVAFRLYKYRKPTTEEIYRRVPEITIKTQRLREDMAGKVNRYIKELMGIQDQGRRIPKWSQVVLFFQNEGCQKNQSPADGKLQKFFCLVKGNKSQQEIINTFKRLGMEIDLIGRIENEQ